MSKRFLAENRRGDEVHDVQMKCPNCKYENSYAVSAAHVGRQLPLLTETYCLSCGQDFYVSMTLKMILTAEKMRSTQQFPVKTNEQNRRIKCSN